MNNILLILIGCLIAEITLLIILGLFLVKKRNTKVKRKLDKDFNTKSKYPKISQLIVIIIYANVFLIIGYLVFANLFPNIDPSARTGVYEISADESMLTNSLRSLYLDQDVLGEKELTEAGIARPIISEKPFNIIFSPKKIIAQNTTAILELNLVNKDSEIYFNDKLISPNLEDYILIKEYSNKYIYIKNTLNKDNLQSANTAEEFISKNFPQASIYSNKEFKFTIPTPTDYTKTNTEISTTFRGGLNLAVYAQGDLIISLTKQDLNNYVGSDEYSLEIKDINGKSYYTELLKDDGDKKDSKKIGEEQDFNIEVKNLPANVYYISFIADKNNQAVDSTLKNIEINSNKLLLIGNILPWEEFSFYKQIISPSTIGFQYWWTDKNQTIQITGAENQKINLNEDWLAKTYNLNLTTQGDYTIKSDVGYLNLYTKTLSVSKKNWFDIPVQTQTKLANHDIIILDKTNLKLDKNSVYYKEEVKVSDGIKFKLQVLDKNKVYLRDIKLTLK